MALITAFFLSLFLLVSPALAYNPYTDNGYFIHNRASFLDSITHTTQKK